jgi:hypothetical protein
VYARAAAWIAGADRWTEATWRDLEAQVAADGTDDAPAVPPSEPADDSDVVSPSAGVLRRRASRGRRVFTPSYLR